MFILEKQPDEILKGVGCDFKNRLDTGEVLISGTITGTKANFVSNIGYNDTQVTCTITGGVHGENIKLEVRALGSLGNYLDGDILVKIRET